MPPFKIDAEVIRNEKINEDVCRLTLMAPDLAEAASAGQFLMVKACRNSGVPLWRRPFSIHHVTPDGGITLLFKVVGKGSKFMSDLHKGEFLNLLGPLGKGFTLPGVPTSVCIVGGGMGIAPLFYLANQLLHNVVKPKKIQLFMGATTANEMSVLAKDFANLGLPVSVATDDGTAGHHGLVTDLLGQLTLDEEWSVYSCGPHPMMKTVARYCLDKNWSCQVSLETLMACGISACLGCAIRSSRQGGNSLQIEPYLHVCKEGPVFEAGEVAWE